MDPRTECIGRTDGRTDETTCTRRVVAATNYGTLPVVAKELLEGLRLLAAEEMIWKWCMHSDARAAIILRVKREGREEGGVVSGETVVRWSDWNQE